jgi:hypothetical protein
MLVSILVRETLRQLLLNQTWAGSDIYDQPIDPLDLMMSRESDARNRAAISVYTHSQDSKDDGEGSQAETQTIDARILIYAPSGRIEIPDSVNLALDADSVGLTLNLMARQCEAAIHRNVEPWSEMWRQVSRNFIRTNSRYLLLETEDGVRFPTVEIQYSINCIPEPKFNCDELYGNWKLFDAALREGGSPTLVAIADMMKSSIVAPESLLPGEAFQINHQTTNQETRNLGFGLIEGAGDTLLEDIGVSVEPLED